MLRFPNLSKPSRMMYIAFRLSLDLMGKSFFFTCCLPWYRSCANMSKIVEQQTYLCVTVALEASGLENGVEGRGC